jgi:hypothetical protein
MMKRKIVKEFSTRVIFTIFIVAFCGIPTWIWLSIRTITNPEGFWQEFALGILGVWLLGGLQVALLIIFLALILMLWFEHW